VELKNAMPGERVYRQRRNCDNDGWRRTSDGRGVWFPGPDGNAYRKDADGKVIQRLNQSNEWEHIDYAEKEITNEDRSDLARYRTLGTPSVLQVRMDADRCILTNLVWNIGDSPEVAHVISPITGAKTQISQTDLDKKPFMLEGSVNTDDNKVPSKSDKIRIQFDHASMACDNQVAMCDEREIRRECATVLNILRTIKAMTRMYPSLHDSDETTCPTQQEHFVCMAQVGDKMWKVKSSPSSSSPRPSRRN
jgi:hypothetical protein